MSTVSMSAITVNHILIVKEPEIYFETLKYKKQT